MMEDGDGTGKKVMVNNRIEFLSTYDASLGFHFFSEIGSYQEYELTEDEIEIIY